MADQPLTILVYSDNARTREKVRSALGGIDLAILDGEATPAGGMGLARQLKDEVDTCPPILVLTGRRDDAWRATWSRAEAAVPHPVDPIALGEAVAGLLRTRIT